MIKDIDKTAKEIIENNFPKHPIDKDGDEVEINWDTCKDELHEKLNDSVGAPVDGFTDKVHIQLSEWTIRRLKKSPWFEKEWDNYVSDYCTDKKYEQEMFNEAKRLP